jgi:CopG family transcriptional regulator/antitoxin EndoAI
MRMFYRVRKPPYEQERMDVLLRRFAHIRLFILEPQIPSCLVVHSRIDPYKLCMYTECMAQKTSTVNISFRGDLLKEIDEVARTESRTRSELVREAARMYIERKKRMNAVIDSIRETVRQRGVSEDDLAAEIAAYRAEKKRERA